jgi:NADH-quinone oxidoreductase subunit H
LDWTFLYRVLVFPGFLFIFILAMVCDWIERKIAAHMQNRVGPMYTGRHGFLQPWADFIKLLMKNSTVPQAASKKAFRLMPLLAISFSMLAAFFLPIDGSNVIPNSAFPGDLILVMVLLSIANFCLFLAGWASNNPYSKVGSARVLIMALAYDVPFIMLAITPAILAGQLSFTGIVQGQLHIPLGFVLVIPWSFVLFIMAMQAELELDPFDVPEAETEVVGGVETEYSGASLALLRFGKDVRVVLGAFIIVDLFLGGPGFWGDLTTASIFSVTALWLTVLFLVKVLIVVVVIEYVAALWARARIDQVLNWNWKYLLPLSIAAMFATAFVAQLLAASDLWIVLIITAVFVVLLVLIAGVHGVFTSRRRH